MEVFEAALGRASRTRSGLSLNQKGERQKNPEPKLISSRRPGKPRR